MFSTHQISILSKANSIIWATFKLSSANTFNLDEVWILPYGKGLNICVNLMFHLHWVSLTLHQTTKFQINSFPNEFLDSSKLKEFAEDSLKFDENGGKFFNRVETTVGKGEIACYEQFLFFPLWFLAPLVEDHRAVVMVLCPS